MEEARQEEKCREDAMGDKNREIRSLENELKAVMNQLRSTETSAHQTKQKLQTTTEEAS